MNMACHHIGIFAEDPQLLIRFYTQSLGFVEGDTRILSPELTEKIFGIRDECRLTKLKQDQAVIEIFAPLHPSLIEHRSRTAGYNHWALEVEDKEAFIQILEKRNVLVRKIDNQGRLIYFVSDPEENLIEIYESR